MRKTILKTVHFIKIISLVLTPLLFTGCMSIHVAARAGNTREIKKQLARGVSPNKSSYPYLDTPLIYASAFGNINTVELLLEKGANVNLTNEGGETPLHYAAKHGFVDVMKILLENGADPSMKGTGCGTPMQWAVRNGQIRSVKTLLDFGVNVDQIGSGNRTALMEAVSKQDMELELIEFLLEKGADVNVGGGCSPLFIAASRDNVEIGRLLLQYGADSTLECEGDKIPGTFLEKLRE